MSGRPKKWPKKSWPEDPSSKSNSRAEPGAAYCGRLTGPPWWNRVQSSSNRFDPTRRGAGSSEYCQPVAPVPVPPYPTKVNCRPTSPDPRKIWYRWAPSGATSCRAGDGSSGSVSGKTAMSLCHPSQPGAYRMPAPWFGMSIRPPGMLKMTCG